MREALDTGIECGRGMGPGKIDTEKLNNALSRTLFL